MRGRVWTIDQLVVQLELEVWTVLLKRVGQIKREICRNIWIADQVESGGVAVAGREILGPGANPAPSRQTCVGLSSRRDIGRGGGGGQ